MGLLVDGVWQQDSAGKEFGSRTEGGHFIRRPTVFHNYVTADGSPDRPASGDLLPSAAAIISTSRCLPVGIARSFFASSRSSTT